MPPFRGDGVPGKGVFCAKPEKLPLHAADAEIELEPLGLVIALRKPALLADRIGKGREDPFRRLRIMALQHERVVDGRLHRISPDSVKWGLQ